MLLEVIDTKDEPGAKTFGRMTCRWEIEPTINFLRKHLFESFRQGILDAQAAGEAIPMPNEEATRVFVEKEIERALALIDQHAARVFSKAQEKLVQAASFAVLQQIDRKKPATKNGEQPR